MLDEISLPKKDIAQSFVLSNLTSLKAKFERYLELKECNRKISILINIGEELLNRHEFVDYFKYFYNFLNKYFDVDWYVLDSGDFEYSILSKKICQEKLIIGR